MTFDELPVMPALAAGLERLGYRPDEPLVRDTIPTAARSHPLVLVAPPAAAYALPAAAGLLSSAREGTRLVLCPAAAIPEWEAGLRRLTEGSGLRLHAATRPGRAARLLAENSVDLLVTAPETALALLQRSALGRERVGGVLLAWPEAMPERDTALAPLMQELGSDTPRLLVTSAPARAADLIERYAHRAVTVTLPVTPLEPRPGVRTVVTGWDRREASAALAIEVLDPARVLHWHLADSLPGSPEPGAPGPDLVIAWDLPLPARLLELAALAPVVLLVPPWALPWVSGIASVRPLRLPGESDEAQDRAARDRAALAALAADPAIEHGLFALAPLFDRYDPAVIAAAAYTLWRRSGTPEAAPVVPPPAATTRVWIGVGRKDGATAADFMGALTRELGLDRTQVGRIELRELFTLVELPAALAEDTARRLTGLNIRRRRVTARVDRPATRPDRRPRSRPTSG